MGRRDHSEGALAELSGVSPEPEATAPPEPPTAVAGEPEAAPEATEPEETPFREGIAGDQGEWHAAALEATNEAPETPETDGGESG